MGKPHSAVYGIPVKELARICHVDLSTARRWKRGAICPPYCAIQILTRDLGCFAAEWRGWTINGEDLVAPDGWTVNRNDALIVPLMHGQISALRAETVRLKEELDNMIEEQPLPSDLPEIISA